MTYNLPPIVSKPYHQFSLRGYTVLQDAMRIILDAPAGLVGMAQRRLVLVRKDRCGQRLEQRHEPLQAVARVSMNGIDILSWLDAWLAACAENDRKPPGDLSSWLPWSMSEERRRDLMAPA